MTILSVLLVISIVSEFVCVNTRTGLSLWSAIIGRSGAIDIYANEGFLKAAGAVHLRNCRPQYVMFELLVLLQKYRVSLICNVSINRMQPTRF